MAEMKRRGFLGLLGGAVAAGPKLAEGIAGSLSVNPMPPMGGYPTSSAAGIAVNTDWKSDRINSLRNLIKGGNPNEARERRQARLYQAEMIERFRLEGMRSVSPQHKARIFVEGNIDRQQRISRMHWERELDDLLTGNF